MMETNLLPEQFMFYDFEKCLLDHDKHCSIYDGINVMIG
jgi:hypothetical protein